MLKSDFLTGQTKKIEGYLFNRNGFSNHWICGCFF